MEPPAELNWNAMLADIRAQHRRTVMLGFDDARRREVNFRQIFGSPILNVPVGQR